MTTADRCRHVRRRIERVNARRRSATYYCPTCGKRTSRTVVRCSCYIDRPYEWPHPITKEIVTLSRLAPDPNCQGCGGTGWVPVWREGEQCCCGLLPWAERCRNCQESHGLIHVCTVEGQAEGEMLDNWAAQKGS